MTDFSENTIVVKLGGSTFGNHDTTLDDLVTLQNKGVSVVVVHGGGDVSTSWLNRLNIPTTFNDGLRITDAETLRVVVAALAGQVNKELVAAIQTRGGKAIGLCGVDGGLLESRIKNDRLGYVGDIVKVNLPPIEAILGIGYIPVIAPLSLEYPAESAEASFILNLNGDTAAGEIAAAMSASSMIFLTDVEGIRGASGELISRLSIEEARNLITSGIAKGGMVPKIEACIRALSYARSARIIDGRVPHVLVRELDSDVKGTTIEATRDCIS